MFVDVKTGLPVTNIIEIDDSIYPILKILWEKGYKTSYSCAGHNDPSRVMISSMQGKEYDKLPVKKTLMVYDSVFNQKKVLMQTASTSIYVVFNEIYTNIKCSNLPKNFKYKEENIYLHDNVSLLNANVSIVECVVDYYASNKDFFNHKRKNDHTINDDINNKRMEFYEWAQKLPTLNKNFTRERKNNNE